MLTAKQQRFCDEYLIDLNGAQAAIRAGYSKKSARNIANENLTKPDIQEYIQERRKAISEKLEITQEEVLRQYQRLAWSDPRKFYDKNGNILPVNKLDYDTAMALTAFDVDEIFGSEGDAIGVTKKVKLADRRAALDSIRDMLGYKSATRLDHTSEGKAIGTVSEQAVKKLLKRLK